MKHFTLTLLVGLSGEGGSLSPGEEYTATPEAAWKMIQSGQAEPAKGQSIEKLEAFVTAKANAEAEKQAQIMALKQKDELMASADDHIAALGDILSVLSTVHVDAVTDITESVHTMLLKFAQAPTDEVGAANDKMRKALESFSEEHSIDIAQVEEAAEAADIKVEITRDGALYKKTIDALSAALGIEQGEA